LSITGQFEGAFAEQSRRSVVRNRRPPSFSARVARRLAVAVGSARLTAAGAHAAPTSLDPAGQTVRCEAANALPVGASPPDDAQSARNTEIPLPAPATLFGLICVLGGLFVLIGLMPDFDGWGPGEHDGPPNRE
jgi:hypothetical protein